ncbi:MAG: hypothetical protein J0I40_14865 [Cellulomonas sp.]|uniref:hypothetical protein n=1 Tax=Cellulomonas sp. 73-92 TaxID=1895740 RepID=UPI001AC1A6AC|nr:hypothetical protein [Cellulomonas sp. 73-92]MBN9376636.1 hypothetical protein [Cellulomonas sp.]
MTAGLAPDTGWGLADSAKLLVFFVLVFPALHVVGRLMLRAKMTRIATRGRPELRAEAAAKARQAFPLFGRIGKAPSAFPTDVYALSCPIVVPPLGDGRPGERFAAPCAAEPDARLQSDGARTDAQLRLAPGTAINVVCFGRVGSVRGGHVLGPAAERCQVTRRAVPDRWQPHGDVFAIDTPAGPAWRHVLTTDTSFLVDTHVDHGGWAFAIGVIGQSPQSWMSGVVDAVLATWRWIEDAGRPAREPEAWPDLPADPLAVDVTVTVGPPECPVATFGASAPALPALGEARLDGRRTEAVVRLSAEAALIVESADGTASAGQRMADAARPTLGSLRSPAGPVLHADTAAGPVWRRRFTVGKASIEHQAHLDHAGRAWMVTLAHGVDEEALVPVLDQALATWRWAEDLVVPERLAGAENPT